MKSVSNETIQSPFNIEDLREKSSFPHPVSRIRVIETHISWVILTGTYAYKIKKPVKFDFVDYSTLQLRHQNCLREIALNRRYANDLYLDVVPIREKDGAIMICEPEQLRNDTTANGDPGTCDGRIVEYAVRMKEFEQASILLNRLRDHRLPLEAFDRFGQAIAEFHRQQPPVSAKLPEKYLEIFSRESNDNFGVLDSVFDHKRNQLLSELKTWSHEQLKANRDRFLQRVKAGRFKDCHGDLHLQNILWYQDRLIPFDGIEFNDELRIIDPLNEIAFPVMDLAAHGYPAEASRLLNSYLETTDNYDDLKLFRLFMVYRALVRIKVAWLKNCGKTHHRVQPTSSPVTPAASSISGAGEKTMPSGESNAWDKYFRIAESCTNPTRPELIITFGFSGSGKSTRALELVDSRSFIRIRSDILRQQLKPSVSPELLYAQTTTEQIYQRLRDQAAGILSAGFSVVVDASFLSAHHRNMFEDLACKIDVDFGILNCDATYSELCSRIRNRHDDPSEATIEVLNDQLKRFDPLAPKELERVIDFTVQDKRWTSTT